MNMTTSLTGWSRNQTHPIMLSESARLKKINRMRAKELEQAKTEQAQLAKIKQLNNNSIAILAMVIIKIENRSMCGLAK